MKANIVTFDNKTFNNVSELPELVSKSITKSEIIELIESNKYSLINNRKIGELNNNYKYEILEENGIIKMFVVSKGRFFTVATKN